MPERTDFTNLVNFAYQRQGNRLRSPSAIGNIGIHTKFQRLGKNGDADGDGMLFAVRQTDDYTISCS